MCPSRSWSAWRPRPRPEAFLHKTGKFSEALSTYKEAERITEEHPLHHRIPVRIGMVYFDMKRYNLAEEAARGGGGCDKLARKEAAELLEKVRAVRRKQSATTKPVTSRPAKTAT